MVRISDQSLKSSVTNKLTLFLYIQPQLFLAIFLSEIHSQLLCIILKYYLVKRPIFDEWGTQQYFTLICDVSEPYKALLIDEILLSDPLAENSNKTQDPAWVRR